jgi:hypothetical protein
MECSNTQLFYFFFVNSTSDERWEQLKCCTIISPRVGKCNCLNHFIKHRPQERNARIRSANSAVWPWMLVLWHLGTLECDDVNFLPVVWRAQKERRTGHFFIYKENYSHEVLLTNQNTPSNFKQYVLFKWAFQKCPKVPKRARVVSAAETSYRHDLFITMSFNYSVHHDSLMLWCLELKHDQEVGAPTCLRPSFKGLMIWMTSSVIEVSQWYIVSRCVTSVNYYRYLVLWGYFFCWSVWSLSIFRGRQISWIWRIGGTWYKKNSRP